MKKPTPLTQYDISQGLIEPYPLAGLGNPNPSVPFNRGNQTSYRGHPQQDLNTSAKDYSVTLLDIDSSIKYYIENNIRPNVIINGGQRIAVPVIYGSPERWSAVQKDGYYRDKGDRILAPLIMYKRISIEKDRNLGNKLDANNPNNIKVFESQYNARNQYDNFSILNNRTPSKELHGVIIPDYVDITYSCILFTDYVEQMNVLVEAFNFASDSYWGEKERYKFRARIDNFSTINEIIQGEDRVAKSTFDIKVHGYIIPNTINKDLVDKGKFYSKAKILVSEQTFDIPSFVTSFNPNISPLGPLANGYWDDLGGWNDNGYWQD